MMFKAVLFDLDNTLLDFWSFKQKARAVVKRKHRKPAPTRYLNKA